PVRGSDRRMANWEAKGTAMTDDDWVKMWLTDEDFDFLFDFLGGMAKPSERKLRLFAVACCRSIEKLITEETSWQAIILAERHADSRVTIDLIRTAHAGAEAASGNAW